MAIIIVTFTPSRNIIWSSILILTQRVVVEARSAIFVSGKWVSLQWSKIEKVGQNYCFLTKSKYEYFSVKNITVFDRIGNAYYLCRLCT